MPDYEGITSIKYPTSDTPTVNTYGTDRVIRQVTSTGEEWKFSYKRAGACVAKVLDAPTAILNSVQTYSFTCKAGQPLTSRTCANGQCTDSVVGVCPDVESEETIAAGWRFYGGVNLETTTVKPGGHKTITRFNSRGMVTEQVDELGQSTKHAYDAKQQRVKTTDALGRETRYEYDAVGNRTATIDPLGRRVDAVYDAATSKPTSLTQYLLGVPSTQGGQQASYTPVIRSMSYDSQGNLTSATDPTGHITQLGCETKGLVSEIVLPAHGSADAIPVIAGGAGTTIVRSARKLTLGYNAGGDLAVLTDAQGNETRFANDALGRSVGIMDPLGYSSQIQYNALDQVTKTTNALAQDSALTYDSAARTTAVVNPANVAIERYGYDAQGRVNRVTDALNQDIGIEYDSSGRPSRITDRKGQATTIGYDAAGQISQISKPGQSIGYQYDILGRLTEVRDATTVSTYQYDGADRLTQTDTATAAGSHRLQYEYDSLDRVRKRTASGTGIAAPEVTTYEWDLANRILGHTSIVGGQAHLTRYEYDVAGRLAARKVQAGNDSANVQNSYGYSPYGQSVTVGPDGTNNPVQYTSRENDGVGLIYHRARYREPVIGWLSEDPIGLDGGLNASRSTTPTTPRASASARLL